MRAMQLLVEYADAEVIGMVEDGENKLEPIESHCATIRLKES